MTERRCRHHKEIHRRDPEGMILHEDLLSLVGRRPTSWPILTQCSAPILGLSQVVLPLHIRRIKRATSQSIPGCPIRGRDFQRRNIRNPHRCQPTTISVRMITRAQRHPAHVAFGADPEMAAPTSNPRLAPSSRAHAELMVQSQVSQPQVRTFPPEDYPARKGASAAPRPCTVPRLHEVKDQNFPQC